MSEQELVEGGKGENNSGGAAQRAVGRCFFVTGKRDSPRGASTYNLPIQTEFQGQHAATVLHPSYLLGQKTPQKPAKEPHSMSSPPRALGGHRVPSTCLLTVHTALGLPGSSETAISDT